MPARKPRPLGPRLGLTLGLLAAVAYVPPTGPSVVERFNTATTNVLGATVTPYGGATWFRANSGGAITNQPTFNAAGNLIPGTNGDANNNNFKSTLAVVGKNTATDERNYTYYFDPRSFVNIANRNSVNVLQFILNAVEITASTSYSKARLGYVGSANGGTFSGNCDVASSGLINAGTLALAWTGDGAALDLSGGDTLRVNEYKSGAQRFLRIYKNEHLVLDGTTDLVAAGVTIVQNMGITAHGNYNVFRIDELRSSNPAVEADFWMVRDTHIAQAAYWNTGDPTAANLNLIIRYSGPTAPANLTYTYYDVTGGTRTPVTGYIDLPLTIGAPSGGEVTAQLFVPTAVCNASNTLVCGVKWNVVVNGDPTAFIECWTPVFARGEKHGSDAQSREVKFYQDVLAYAYTDAANAWFIDASNDPASGFLDDSAAGNANRRNSRSDTTTTRATKQKGLGHRAAIASTLFGHSYLEMWRCGKSAQDQIQRGAATANQTVFLAGMRRAGNDFGTQVFRDHAYDVDNANGSYGALFDATAVGLWKAEVYAKIDQMESRAGHRGLFILEHSMPRKGVAYSSAVAARADAFNQMINQIISSNGDGRFASSAYGSNQRFFLGANLSDVVISGDSYHYTNSLKGSGIVAFRTAHDWAKVRGVASTGRFGLTLSAVTRISATVIRETYDAPAHAVSAYLRGDTAGSPNCGNLYFDNVGLTTARLATAVGSPSAISGGQVTIDKTFASLPATLYVVPPSGADPINPNIVGAYTTDSVASAGTGAPALVLSYGDPGTVGVDVFDPPVEPYTTFAGGVRYLSC